MLYLKGIFHLTRLGHGNAWHGNASVMTRRQSREEHNIYGQHQPSQQVSRKYPITTTTKNKLPFYRIKLRQQRIDNAYRIRRIASRHRLTRGRQAFHLEHNTSDFDLIQYCEYHIPSHVGTRILSLAQMSKHRQN